MIRHATSLALVVAVFAGHPASAMPEGCTPALTDAAGAIGESLAPVFDLGDRVVRRVGPDYVIELDRDRGVVSANVWVEHRVVSSAAAELGATTMRGLRIGAELGALALGVGAVVGAPIGLLGGVITGAVNLITDESPAEYEARKNEALSAVETLTQELGWTTAKVRIIPVHFDNVGD